MSVPTNGSISLQGCDDTHRWFVPSPGKIARLAWIAGLAGLCSSHPASAGPATSCRQAWMPNDAPAFCPWRSEAPLPDPKSYFAVASVNSTPVYADDTQFASITRDAGHGVVTDRDRLYVIAGSAPGGQLLKEVLHHGWIRVHRYHQARVGALPFPIA